MDRYPKSDSALDKEINIRVSPRSMLKTFIFLLLLTSIFYLGRWSVSQPEVSSNGSGFSIFGSEDETPAPKAAAPKTSSPTAATIDNSAVAAAKNQEETPAAAASESATDSNSTGDVNVITKYTKVAIAVADVTTQWKGTYGKITAIQYTITNNEAGTIKPDHFAMIVEGYDDYEKKIPLPLSSKTINAGETKTANLLVPQGFAYSSVTAGDLTNVKITFKLIDGNNKDMSMYEKQYVLKSS